MKAVCIILAVYGISWAILLIVYLCSKFHKETHPEPFFDNKEKEPWYFYALLIVLSPIVVLYIPYSLISDAIKDKKHEKWQKERDEKKRELEIQQTKAFQNFTEDTSIPLGEDYINKGELLKNIVWEKEYKRIMECMSEVHLPTAYSLEVKLAQNKGLGSNSTLFVKTPSGDHCDVFDTITVEDTPMGAMEVYLLYEIGHYLPLFWHANYSYRNYIYSTEDLMSIRTYEEHDKDTFIEKLKQLDVSPTIVQNQGKYYVSCCYWSNFGGLIREVVEIEIKGNKVVNIFDVDYDTLYEYQCGILF